MRIVHERIGDSTVTLYDLEPTPDRICDDVARGLRTTPKALPSKYFYDDAGARLFERIMELDAYYPTRTEIAILRSHVEEIAGAIGEGAALIEFGSGSGDKTWIILRHLRSPAAYVPVDISRAQLVEFAGRVIEAIPQLPVVPVCADYTAELALPRFQEEPRRRVAFFPGSTIGNFEPPQASAFLERVRRLVGPEGGMLLGLDLRKDRSIIEAAYNDPEGVTAEFNLNLLTRINRECGADFNVANFEHHASFDEAASRIEMRLVSAIEQTVRLAPAGVGKQPAEIDFEAGESILTEYSHKYDLESFGLLVEAAGWQVDRVWNDDQEWFAVVLLR